MYLLRLLPVALLACVLMSTRDASAQLTDVETLPLLYRDVEITLEPPGPSGPHIFDYDVLEAPGSRSFEPGSAPTSGPDAEGDRNILWMHGLAGNRTAWQAVGPDIARRYRATSSLIEYSDLQDVVSLDDVADPLLHGPLALLPSPSEQVGSDPRVDPDSTIYVGHSLGGVIGRYLPIYHGEVKGYDIGSFPYGGIATVATPHAGSEAAGARAEYTALLTDGCLDLTAGPLLDLVDDIPNVPAFQLQVADINVFTVNPFSASNLVEDFQQGACTNPFFRLLTQSLAVDNFLPVVSEEIDLNSDRIVQINTTPDPFSLAKANIVTAEEHPAALRLLGSAIAAVQQEPVYSANNDEAAMQLIEQQLANFRLAQTALRNEANFIDGWHVGYVMLPDGRVIPADTQVRLPRKQKARDKRNAANAYGRGINFLTTLNDEWLAISGATVRVPTGDSTFSCDCEYYDYGDLVGTSSDEANSIAECEETSSQDDVCRATFVEVNFRTEAIPTDGVATLASQRSWVNQRTGVPVNQFQAENNNHLQIRNSEQTDRAFNTWLFAGEGDQFFRLTKRNP